MNKIIRPFLALALVFGASVLAQGQSTAARSYAVSQTFHLGGEGAWDYLTVDADHHLLFIPRSTHTMVLDTATGGIVADIPGQKRNHGVALVPAAGRGFISDGNDASVTIFDLKTYQVLGKVKAQPDADGIIYDPASNKVLLVSGDGGVLIPISPDVDGATGQTDAAVDLGGKPEFLVADGRGKAFINLTDKNLVAVIDTKSMKVIAKWPTAPGGAPVGMSMDRTRRRLFIGCRNPQKLIVMSADDGKILADLPIGSGVDATHFDGDIFASCRDGTLAVARETSPGNFEIVQTVKTAQGAATMGLDAKAHALYLPSTEYAQPAREGARPAPKPNTFMILVVKPTA
jgi:DNA-binding beta-propeller fold protein YncE